MPSSLSRQIGAVLNGALDALPLDELLARIDDFVAEWSSSEHTDALMAQFEELLQAVYHDSVDYSNLRLVENFLIILRRLAPIIPSTSIISWFEVVFRPALREPKLATTPRNYAKDLIVQALCKYPEVSSDPEDNSATGVASESFRKRLFELYLLDAFNVGSENDVLEWTSLDGDERERRSCWKENLEDILIKYGQENAEDLFTEILAQFENPSSRLQLFTFLNILSLKPSFSTLAPVLSKHQLLRHILLSIFLDNCSTVCSAALTFIVKSLPYFALYTRSELQSYLPHLLAALARVLCWKNRVPVNPDRGDILDPPFERELDEITQKLLHPRPDLHWKRLEASFSSTTSLPPDMRPFFSLLFYLFPSNVLSFLRRPVESLISYNVETPYTVDWKDAFNENEIRLKSESLLREHICHPLLIWKDTSKEQKTSDFWSDYSISRIISEAMMMDVRNLAAGLRERYDYTDSNDFSSLKGADEGPLEEGMSQAAVREETEPPPEPGGELSRFITPLDLSTGKIIVSLADMVQASNALRSNIDVEFVAPDVQWITKIPSRSPSPSKRQQAISQRIDRTTTESAAVDHLTQVVAGLQREVLLLQNELNFEIWIQRENVKHIGRLYQDRLLIRSAEAERQGLYNKLRKYRSQVIGLEAELGQARRQAISAKNKYAEWNTELQNKLKELREERKTWISEIAVLRNAEKEAKALAGAQAKLLSDATEQVFQLQTQKKENQHKIDRLHDYERQIEQHVKIQKLWDQDYAKFNARGDQLLATQNEMQQMRLRLESHERTQETMEEAARASRRQIQTLEFKLSLAHKRAENRRPFTEDDLQALVAEKASLKQTIDQIREEKGELSEEIEELRAMVEILKAQASGRRGLISDPKMTSVPTA